VSANSGDLTQLGIALDGTLLVAAWRATRASADASGWRTLVVPCDATPASIATAVAEVAAAAPTVREVAITLLRPLASARALEFPSMKRGELETVLERDWMRHVIGLRHEPHVATVRATNARSWRAAFAPAATLEALDAAARTHGWTVRDVRTTEDALAAAAIHALPAIARMGDAIVPLCGGTGAIEVVRLRNGAPIASRQLVAGTVNEIVAFVRSSASGREAASATILILGDRERGEPLARELGAHGLRAQHSSLARLPADSPAAFLAGAALLAPARLPLVSLAERSVRLRRSRIATWCLAAAAVLLAVLGLAIENFRLGRELEAIGIARAAIAANVNDAVARRTSLESATDMAGALREHELLASQAAAALAAVTLALPENTALSTLQISGDSVTIEGESERSADVYAALRGAPVLADVRLAGPLRQERQADDAPVEHFAFTARLKRATR
jgi:hypothetical protein